MEKFVALAVAPFVFLAIKTLVLWTVRRYAPRWERILWSSPIDLLRRSRRRSR